jgi:hypothetical protein
VQNLDFNNTRTFASVKRSGHGTGEITEDAPASRAGRPTMLRTAFLWIHVLCGASWVAVSLSFVLAAGASTETERAGFAARVAPVLNRLNLAAIVILPVSGIANLIFVARERHFSLPTAFVEVLSAKLLLLCGMAAALALAWGAAARLGSGTPPRTSGDGERRLLWLYSAMAAMGAVALMLGLWLAGSA